VEGSSLVHILLASCIGFYRADHVLLNIGDVQGLSGHACCMSSAEPHSLQGGKAANLLASSVKSALYAGATLLVPDLSISHGGMHRTESKRLWVFPVWVGISLPGLILRFPMGENHTNIQTLIFVYVI